LKNGEVFNGYHGFVPENYTDKDLKQERRYNIGLVKIRRYIQYHIDERRYLSNICLATKDNNNKVNESATFFG
jgi:hypothetical protein